MTIPFIKMHGLGNDFAIFDARPAPLTFSREQASHIADRRFGVGCDQVIVIEPSSKADAFMRIYNPDGGEVSSCGNATRCVAWLLMQETSKDRVTIETKAGLLACERAGERRIRADMGEPKFGWQDIPLSQDCDTLNLPITIADLGAPAAVSMGNPHMVFMVADAAAIPVAQLGAELEHHKLFPGRANIGFAQVTGKDTITLRVWERGTGETLACGTAACAALVALSRRGLIGRKATVQLPGGALEVEWNDANRMLMTGEVVRVFEGGIDV